MSSQTNAEIEYTLTSSDWVAFYCYIQDKEDPSRFHSGWSLFWKLTFGVLGNFCIAPPIFGIIIFGIIPVPVIYVLNWAFYVANPAGHSPPAAVFVGVVFAGALLGGILMCLFLFPSMRTYDKFIQTKRMERWVGQCIKSGTIQLTRRYRVGLDPDGLVAQEDWQELGNGIEYLEKCQGRASWEAISAIDTTKFHAFFAVNNKEYAIVPASAFLTQEAFLEFVEKAKRLRAGGLEADPRVDVELPEMFQPPIWEATWSANSWFFAKGSVIKFVRCESCGNAYAYEMKRAAPGVAFLGSLGYLRNKLQRSCDPVPCPECGWYQRKMVAQLREKYKGWMKVLAWFCLPAAIPAFMVMGIFALSFSPEAEGGLWSEVLFDLKWLFLVPAFVVAGMLSLFILQNTLSAEYDPNIEDVEARKNRGQARALGRIRLLEMVKESAPFSDVLAVKEAIAAIPPFPSSSLQASNHQESATESL